MSSGKLTIEERVNFETTIVQRHSCYAYELAKAIMENRHTAEDLLQAELLLKKGCATIYMLQRIYDDLCLIKFHEKLEREEIDHNSKRKRGKK